MESVNSEINADHVQVTSTPVDHVAVNGGPALLFGNTALRSIDEDGDLVSVQVGTSTNSPRKPSNNTVAKKRNKISKYYFAL